MYLRKMILGLAVAGFSTMTFQAATAAGHVTGAGTLATSTHVGSCMINVGTSNNPVYVQDPVCRSNF